MLNFQTIYSFISSFIQTQGYYRIIEHLFVLIILIKIIKSIKFQKRGKIGIFQLIVKFFIRLSKNFGFFRNKIEKQLQGQAAKSFFQMTQKNVIKPTYSFIPDSPLDHAKILNQIQNRQKADIDPTIGKTFGYVYQHSKKHSHFTAECFQKYIHSNALNPLLFNSLRVLQVQIIRMVANLFHGNENCVGSVTSCGTQSLILAMKLYRDYRGNGQVIMCETGHPGINKGCHYVGLNVTQIPYDKNFKMDIKALRKKITTQTVVVVCSAAQYPHGIVDNIQQVAKVCLQYGVPLHVDAAIGGFVLPFIQKLGKNIFKPWDFRIKGVTSINADIHKYGYCPKGASVLISANSQIRRKQFFTFATWPGGIYISPTILGSRNGGCIAAAWGSLLGLGIQGFKQCTRRMLQTLQKIKKFVNQHPDLQLVAEPEMTIIAFKSKTLNIYKIADCLDTKGFKVEKQTSPDCIHLSIMPQHQATIDQLIIKLGQAVEQVRDFPDRYESGSKAIYGTLAKIPDEVLVQDYMVYFMDEVYRFQ